MSRSMQWMLIAALALTTACRDKANHDNDEPSDEGEQSDEDDLQDEDPDPIDPDPVDPDPVDPGPDAESAWTVFVYGHGDHNLSNSLLRDIVEMARAQISGDLRVVVLADFDASQTIADGSDRFPSGGEWLLIEGGGAEPKLLQRVPELDLDDPEVLAESVATAFASYPSKHRALMLWDHGGSWDGGFGSDTQDGTRSQLAPMSAGLVAEAVRVGLEAAEVTAPLDIFSFDTCLMAGAEVAWEFRDLTNVYIANAEFDYGDGWDYTGFLTHLSQHPDDSAQAIAQREVVLWDQHHRAAGANDRLLRSHVALDLTRLDDFGSAYGDLTDLWLEGDLNGVELARAGYFTLPPYMDELESQSGGDQIALRDVGHFLSRLSLVSNAQLSAAAQTALDALDAMILGSSQGDLRREADQYGVHIELPLAATMSQERLNAYGQLAGEWARTTRWDEALLAYGLLNDHQAPILQSAIMNGTAPDRDHLPTIQFMAPDSDLAEAEIELGLLNPQNPDQLVHFGIIAKGAIEAGVGYQMPWNGQFVSITDGQGGVQPIHVRIWEDVGVDVDSGEILAPLLAIDGVLRTADGQQAAAAMLFQDGESSADLLALLDPPAAFTFAELADYFPGASFTPVLPTTSISTGEQSLVSGSAVRLGVASMPVSTSVAPAGAYALLTAASDVFGNADGVAQRVDIVNPIVQ